MDSSLQNVKFVVRQDANFYPPDPTTWSYYYWLREKTLYRLHSDLSPIRSHISLEGLDQMAVVA